MQVRVPPTTQSYTPRHRIGIGAAMLMIGVTALIDCLQFLLDLIPFVGWIPSALISMLMIPLMWLWFKICGSSFVRTPAGVGAMLFGEVALSFLPLLTARTAWSIYRTRKDDKAYNAKMAQKAQGSRQEQMMQIRGSNAYRSPQRGRQPVPQAA